MDDSDRLSALRQSLRERLGSERYDVWLGDATELRYANDALHLTCSSGAEMEWLRRRLHNDLQRAARNVWGPGVPVVYAVREAPAASDDAATSRPARRQPAASCRASAAEATAVAEPRRSRNAIRFSWESLAVGSANRLAVATVEAALEQPGRFSPLLVYGPSGVGKSHLLYAASGRFRRDASRPAVLAMTAEQFTAQFLAALQDRTLPRFRDKCRTVDVLLIDDVQFLIGKKATLEEALYTIEALGQRGRQVILTADRPPNEFPRTAAALAGKLAGGLALQVDPPDYEMRVAMVEAIADRVDANLGEGVAPLVAQQVVGSARLLGGAVNRLVATSMAVGQPITVGLAQSVLTDFARQHTPQVKLADVQRAVCEVFGVEPTRLKSKEKTRGLVEPRMIAMWLSRRYTRAALSEIGEYFGRRSHSTVVAAQKKCDRLVSEKATLVVGDADYPIDDAIRRIEAVLRSA